MPSNPSKDYYYILRDTPNIQSLIVEYGFLDSVGDDPDQLKNNYERYAEAVVRALADYSNVKYIPISGENFYIVKKGDTLWNIARDNGISVNDLKNINNLSSNTLSIGQYLKIPNKNIDTINNDYIVKKGDTLYQISKSFNTTVDKIKELNNLTSNTLSIGQTLKVPKDNIYIVKKGDTLYQIAKKYNTTVTEIVNLNNLKTTSLSIGQQLNIP